MTKPVLATRASTEIVRPASDLAVSALYEPKVSIAEARARCGMTQADLAGAALVARPNVSALEKGHTRVSLAKARRLSAALGLELDEAFRAVLPATAAATAFGVDRHALVAAALDDDWPHVTAHAIEKRAAKTRIYFVEDELRAQLERLPTCRADECDEQALRPGGYCTTHKWKASHERIRGLIAQPHHDRLWLTEDEASRETGRAWDVIHRATVSGDLRSWKAGGCRIIKKADLAPWDDAQPRPGLHSSAWQEETDGMVALYQAGKSHRVVARRAARQPNTVLRRLHLRGVQMRQAVGPLAQNWCDGTGAARATVEKWDRAARDLGRPRTTALRWYGRWGGAKGAEDGQKGGRPVKWGSAEETAAMQKRILELNRQGLDTRAIAADVFDEARLHMRVWRFLNR